MVKRENAALSKFPEVSFKLGWRGIIDIETQQAIIGEAYRISYEINPKIWLANHLLHSDRLSTSLQI
jgi:hypothetical protein